MLDHDGAKRRVLPRHVAFAFRLHLGAGETAETAKYPIAEEIFRRFEHEGAHSIAKDLNARSVTPPAVSCSDMLRTV